MTEEPFAQTLKVKGGWAMTVPNTPTTTGPYKPFYPLAPTRSRSFRTYGYRRHAEAAAERYNQQRISDLERRQT